MLHPPSVEKVQSGPQTSSLLPLLEPQFLHHKVKGLDLEKIEWRAKPALQAFNRDPSPVFLFMRDMKGKELAGPLPTPGLARVGVGQLSGTRMVCTFLSPAHVPP